MYSPEYRVPAEYAVDSEALLTPALLIYPEIVRGNIAAMIRVLEGDSSRWRPHVKTAKLERTMKLLVEAGVETAKCATTLELRTACRAGFTDVLVAYPHAGRNARRVAEIAEEFPAVRVSALVEAESQLEEWRGSRVDLFIDVNPGMDRTGIAIETPEAVARLAEAIREKGLAFRGLHFYDGHSTDPDLTERTKRAHARYGELLKLVSFLESRSLRVGEVVTAGTPAVPCAVSYQALWNGGFLHRVSPGTVVYCDLSSLRQLPAEYGFKPAALVISRVVSRPEPSTVTCDAGHKSVSVDSGVPNCEVLSYPGLVGQKPSEEHLPFVAQPGSSPPELGQVLYLVPRHICPTVNNFDRALFVERGRIAGVEPVTARGREGPI